MLKMELLLLLLLLLPAAFFVGVVDGIDISAMRCTTLAKGNQAAVKVNGGGALTDYSNEAGQLLFYSEFTTPQVFSDAYEDLFLGGGESQCGGYFGGVRNSGLLFFGVQCNENGSPEPATMETPLTANTKYKVEMLYDRANAQASARWNRNTIHLVREHSPFVQRMYGILGFFFFFFFQTRMSSYKPPSTPPPGHTTSVKTRGTRRRASTLYPPPSPLHDA